MFRNLTKSEKVGIMFMMPSFEVMKMKLRVQSYNFSTENMIKYQVVKRKYHYAPHIHQFAELVIPLKGSLSITVNETTEKLNVGQAAFVLPFQPHSYNSEEYNELAIFVFSSGLIPEIYDTANGMLQNGAVFTPERIAFSVFEEQIFGKDNFDLMEIKGAFYLLLNNFLKTVDLTRVSKYHDVSANIVKYITEHITEKISVGDIAKTIGYTPNYVSSVINRVFGENLSAVTAAIRMEKALYLLCNTNKSCYNICYECGFGSERTFFRKVKELTGASPTEYRSKSKINKNGDNRIIKHF